MFYGEDRSFHKPYYPPYGIVYARTRTCSSIRFYAVVRSLRHVFFFLLLLLHLLVLSFSFFFLQIVVPKILIFSKILRFCVTDDSDDIDAYELSGVQLKLDPFSSRHGLSAKRQNYHVSIRHDNVKSSYGQSWILVSDGFERRV